MESDTNYLKQEQEAGRKGRFVVRLPDLVDDLIAGAAIESLFSVARGRLYFLLLMIATTAIAYLLLRVARHPKTRTLFEEMFRAKGPELGSQPEDKDEERQAAGQISTAGTTGAKQETRGSSWSLLSALVATGAVYSAVIWLLLPGLQGADPWGRVVGLLMIAASITGVFTFVLGRENFQSLAVLGVLMLVAGSVASWPGTEGPTETPLAMPACVDAIEGDTDLEVGVGTGSQEPDQMKLPAASATPESVIVPNLTSVPTATTSIPQATEVPDDTMPAEKTVTPVPPSRPTSARETPTLLEPPLSAPTIELKPMRIGPAYSYTSALQLRSEEIISVDAPIKPMYSGDSPEGCRPLLIYPAPSLWHYEVQEGDSLWDIARRYGTTADELVDLNRTHIPGLERQPDCIRPGWKLQLP